MAICIGVYAGLLGVWWMQRRGSLTKWLNPKEVRTVFWVLFACNTIATLLFVAQELGQASALEVLRNDYGAGTRTEQYEVTIEGELEEEQVSLEVEEREYTSSEIQEIFQEIMKNLDQVILGENKSFDHVEKDLNLVRSMEGYPVAIQWELSNYQLLDSQGHIFSEVTVPEGTLVEIRGNLSYREAKAVYVANAMIYPPEQSHKEIWITKLKQSVADIAEKTKYEKGFSLPREVDGKEIIWEKEADTRGYYVLLLGAVGSVLLLWNKRQEAKESKQKREEQMIRDYPDLVSKFALLIGTGMTVKQVWLKVVQTYEEQKAQLGTRAVYDEMCITCYEMQSGIAEAESYERFGKRCETSVYMKFGALLSQNLRKGSKGLTEVLKVEAIQAFENRKSTARRRGEEAGAKLLLPMMGMLAVVMLIVIVPAFLSMQF